MKGKRERIYNKINDESCTWKEFFYYGLHTLIKKDAIFSKLPYLLGDRRKINHFDSQLNFMRGALILPILFFWKLLLIQFERKYYKIKYPHVFTLQDIETESFDYLFILNTKDHTIAALPVLENMETKAKCLIITFKSVYIRYKYDFDNLKNTKIVFFDYELKNLALEKYWNISKESSGKFKLLSLQNLDNDLERLIKIDKNFIKFHLKTELIQYYLFDKIFNAFDIKGAVSIVFSTAFELCKERKIPTFILQHGIGGKWHGHPYVSDYWFTFDDISKDSLDEWLDYTVNVLALGSPRFEYFKNAIASQRNVTKFNIKIGKSGYKKIVTYIAVGAENDLMFQALKDLRNTLPEYVNLIIKSHPRVSLNALNLKKELQKIFTQKELQQTTFIRNEQDFYEILSNSDVVITISSTGMLESIAADIPTLQINFTEHSLPKQYKLSTFGWKEPIKDPIIMINETISILNNKDKCKKVIEKQRWLKNRMFKNFDNCGKVIAETIIKESR